MSQTGKVVLAAVSLIVLMIAIVPFASLAVSALSNADSGAVFVGVVGAFGFGFVLSVPRER